VIDLPPAPAVIATIRRDLYLWLGPRGFLWHAGCAIYPQLRSDLTVHIGRVLRVGPGADAPVLYRDTPDDRRLLDRMTALPWFRAGRMPEWLRKDVLAALEPDDRERASAVVRELFTGGSGRTGPLAIWWPRTGALAMPPDAVMVNALMGGRDRTPSAVLPERERELAAGAQRAVLTQELSNALVAGLASIGLWYFAPDFAASPHALGAWFPLFAYASACLVTFGLLLLMRRALPATRPPPSTAAAERAAPSQPETDKGSDPNSQASKETK
jgi:hypothetical protein